MSKNQTTKSQNSATTTTGGSATTDANANTLWNLGMNAVNSGPAQYNNPLTAGLSPDQLAAFTSIAGAGTVGQSQLGQGSAAAAAAAGYQAPTITAAQASGAPLVSTTPGGIQAPTIGAGPAASGRDVSTQNLTDTDLSKYENPYTSDVINSALTAIKQQQGQTLAGQAGAQAAGGAFGDARSGIAQALTNQLFDQNTQSTIANLYNNNYTQAAQNAQTDLARQLAAQQSNQSKDVSTSTANLNAGTQANIASGQLAFNAGSTNAQNSLTAALANASNGLNASEFNAGQTNSVGATNASNDLAANAQRLSAAGTLGNLGLQTQSQVLNQANAQGAAGQVEQNTTQAGLTAQYQDFLRQQGYNDTQIQQLLGIYGQTAPATGLTTQQTGTSTSTTPQSLLPDALSAGATILGGPLGGALAKTLTNGIGKSASSGIAGSNGIG